MANSKQAKKRALQSEKHRKHNVSLRSMYRTYIKHVVTAVTAGDKEKAQQAYAKAVPMIDGMVNKKIMHKNKAARYKSRLAQRINKMS